MSRFEHVKDGEEQSPSSNMKNESIISSFKLAKYAQPGLCVAQACPALRGSHNTVPATKKPKALCHPPRTVHEETSPDDHHQGRLDQEKLLFPSYSVSPFLPVSYGCHRCPHRARGCLLNASSIENLNSQRVFERNSSRKRVSMLGWSSSRTRVSASFKSKLESRRTPTSHHLFGIPVLD